MDDIAVKSINFYAILLWLSKHLNIVPAVVTLIEKVLASDGVKARWEAIKQLVDTLLPIIDDYPREQVSAFSEAEYEALEARFAAEGYDFERLRGLIPVLELLLPLILKLAG